MRFAMSKEGIGNAAYIYIYIYVISGEFRTY